MYRRKSFSQSSRTEALQCPVYLFTYIAVLLDISNSSVCTNNGVAISGSIYTTDFIIGVRRGLTKGSIVFVQQELASDSANPRPLQGAEYDIVVGDGAKKVE